MKKETNVPLHTLTTLKVGGSAHVVVYAETVSEIAEAVAYAKENKLPFYVLGEGSNVLAHIEGYDGVIVRPVIQGISYEIVGNETLVTAGAGVSWDALVRDTASRGLWGIENLAGIPGTVGAAPVQNIGAYGTELTQTLTYVAVYDTKKEEALTIPKEECAFAYRDSRFKHEPNLIITHVTLTLTKNGTAYIEYGDLRKAQERGEDLSTPEAIGDAVRKIRSGKFPDLREHGTAGSFFKNPIVSKETYDALVAKHGDVPQFAHPDGIKIPLAFILDRILNLRGYRKGKAWLFEAQPLVLVLDAGGTSEDIEQLAQEVEQRVKEKTGITIEREVRTMTKK